MSHEYFVQRKELMCQMFICTVVVEVEEKQKWASQKCLENGHHQQFLQLSMLSLMKTEVTHVMSENFCNRVMLEISGYDCPQPNVDPEIPVNLHFGENVHKHSFLMTNDTVCESCSSMFCIISLLVCYQEVKEIGEQHHIPVPRDQTPAIPACS